VFSYKPQSLIRVSAIGLPPILAFAVRHLDLLSNTVTVERYRYRTL
jgi:hypothetical protein